MRTPTCMVLTSLVACQGYLPSPMSATAPTVVAVSLPPLANAGADGEILRGYQARLEGGGSYHPQSLPISYNWRQTAGDAVHLSNTATATPSFLAPLAEQVLGFELSVDDGVWTTSDEVQIYVRALPSAVAPYVLAAADRSTSLGADATAEDIIDTNAPQPATWTAITPDRSQKPRVGEAATSGVAIYRVSAEANGLRSAPDYLLIHPNDVTAPTLTVTGPTEAQPGTTVTLEVSATAEASIRWEQIAGQAALQETAPSQGLIAIPTRPQELLFRIHARLDAVESAPILHAITVSSPLADVPVLLPDQDLSTHEGNVVTLDADGLEDGQESLTFVWTQTFGAKLETTLDDTGRFLSFVAPAAPTELAFAVVPVLSDDGVAVEGAPAVAQVTVLDDANNTGPAIVTCWSPAAPQPGDVVSLTAWVRDAEWDSLVGVSWTSTQSNAELSSNVVTQEGPCTATGVSTRHAAYEATFTMPTDAVEIGVQACDDLEACTTETFVF